MDSVSTGSMVPAVIEAFFEDNTFLRTESVTRGVTIGNGITFVTGPSGCGKTTLLQEIVEADPTWLTLPDMQHGVALIDHLTGSLGERVSMLARFGLGDAQVIIRDFDGLSDGQRFRARLALAFAAGFKKIIVDECLATVDATTASVVAHNVQRLCRLNGVNMIAATTHDEIEVALRPDRTIVMRSNSVPEIRERSGPMDRSIIDDISIGQGTISDFELLQRFHYYPSLDFDPSQRDISIVIARYREQPIAARLYCAPYPTAWASALPLFADINKELTLGQRLVVDPMFRGLGLARAVCSPDHAPLETIYTRSVMSRFTDMHHSLGYQRHEPLTNGLDALEGGDLRRNVLRVLVTEFADYRSVISRPIHNDEASTIAQWFAGHIASLPPAQLEISAKSTRMGGYVAQKNRELIIGNR